MLASFILRNALLVFSMLCCSQSLFSMVPISDDLLNPYLIQGKQGYQFDIPSMEEIYLIAMDRGAKEKDKPSLNKIDGTRNFNYVSNTLKSGNYFVFDAANNNLEIGKPGRFFSTKQGRQITSTLYEGKNPFPLTAIPGLIDSSAAPTTGGETKTAAATGPLAAFPIPFTFPDVVPSEQFQFTVACNNILDEDPYKGYSKTNKSAAIMPLLERKKYFDQTIHMLKHEVQPDILCFQETPKVSYTTGPGYAMGGDLVIQFNQKKFTHVESKFIPFTTPGASKGGLLYVVLNHTLSHVNIIIVNVHLAGGPGQKVGTKPDGRPLFDFSGFRVKQTVEILSTIDNIKTAHAKQFTTIICGDFNTDLHNKITPTLYNDVFDNTLLVKEAFGDAASNLPKTDRFTAFGASGEAENIDYIFYTASLKLIKPIQYFTSAKVPDPKKIEEQVLTHGIRKANPTQDTDVKFHSDHAILVAIFEIPHGAPAPASEIGTDFFKKLNTDLHALSSRLTKVH